MARDELISVHWDSDTETWTVDARPHGDAELATLLGLAHDIATGG